LGNGGQVYKILSEIGLSDGLDSIKFDNLYRCFFPGESFIVPSNLEDYLNFLSQRFPEEKIGIKTLFGTMGLIYEDSKNLPSLTSLLTRYKDKTQKELLDEFIKDGKLKSIVSSLFYGGLPPSKISAIQRSCSIMGAFSNGAFYPVGGSQALVNILVNGLKRAGGELELGRLVNRIIVKNGRAIGIETSDGKRIKANWIVSNSDIMETFFKLIGGKELEGINPAFLKGLREMQPSLSSFDVYLGVDLDIKSIGITDHEIIVHESWNIEEEFKELLEDGFSGVPYSITIPTLSDPSLAPVNHHIVIIFTPAPYHLKGGDWKADKERITNEMILKAESVIPGLSKHIVVKDSATPLTKERYTLNFRGSIGGWANYPNIIFNKPLPKTPVENLYLTGHWTLPGGGISGVISSGWAVANMIGENSF
jgi:prolycopene isomerase